MKFSEKEILFGSILLIIVIALLLNLFWANSSSAKFCGDGICSENEGGVCKLDCSWCGDGSCNANECSLGCTEDCSLSQCENRKCEPEKGENCINTPNDCKCVGGYCNTETAQCNFQSCGNNICDSGENLINCPNDCQEQYQAEDTSDINYPIILVHGHSRTASGSGGSINHFQEFQQRLSTEGQAENKGIVLPKDMNIADSAWGKLDKPVVVRTTYYLNAYDEFGSSIGPEDNNPISVYSNRLEIVVNNVLKYTGKNKVIIVAHSMGGLVARDYIKNHGGLNKVDKLVTIGTPNHGIYADISDNCEDALFGREEASPECNDMTAGSIFLNSLNLGDETPGDVKYMTISGKATNGLVSLYGFFDYQVCQSIDEYHDEVICVSSVPLNGAVNKEIACSEIEGSDTLHKKLINPSETPEVYNQIIDFLSD